MNSVKEFIKGLPEEERRQFEAGAILQGPEEWPDPIPLNEYDLPPFPLEVLPDWLRDFVAALSEATQTPPDLGGVLALSVLAAATAKKAVVQAGDGWKEPLNIYAVVALPPASRKTAVFSALCDPVEAYERELIEIQRPEIEKARSRRDTLEQALVLAKREAAKNKAGIQKPGGGGKKNYDEPF